MNVTNRQALVYLGIPLLFVIFVIEPNSVKEFIMWWIYATLAGFPVSLAIELYIVSPIYNSLIGSTSRRYYGEPHNFAELNRKLAKLKSNPPVKPAEPRLKSAAYTRTTSAPETFVMQPGNRKVDMKGNPVD